MQKAQKQTDMSLKMVEAGPARYSRKRSGRGRKEKTVRKDRSQLFQD